MSAARVRLPPGALESEVGRQRSLVLDSFLTSGPEATPSNETDPSRPCGVSASTPLCRSGRTGSTPVRGAGQFRVSSCEFRVRQLGTRNSKLGTARGTVRQPAERPSSNLGECGFDSHPCYWSCVGRRWDAGRPVKPPHTARQVRFLTGALNGPFVYRQDIGFSAREGGFDFAKECSGAAHTALWLVV